MLNMIQKELEKQKNMAVTENGAIGHKTSGSALVDMNYQVSSLRSSDEEEIITLFDKVFRENREYALKWLFFARDVREGLGERRLFRICYSRLYELDIDIFVANLKNIPEYGRWDDLLYLIGMSEHTDDIIIAMLKEQLWEDLENIKVNRPISLLGKWMPSENASSKSTKSLARKIIKLLNISPRQYRLMLTKLRKYLNVVEAQMCAQKWSQINYEEVPSLANLRYRNAFDRHDYERRQQYLSLVSTGNAKLNMSVGTPVDIVSRYTSDNFYRPDFDETLELAWQNLKDIMVQDTLVVADGSGSMFTRVSHNIKAIDVANALAIYTSEHNHGVYKNKYITFSNNPQFVEFDEYTPLMDKICIALKHDEVENTNIEAVFDLILATAIQYNIPQDEMIKNVLIISDMEFDAAQSNPWGYRRNECSPLTLSLFGLIKQRYEAAGYNLPRLIFWNVNSRTNVIPLTENELGVVLISGFSQNALKMVMTNKYDPYDVLVETITSERYDPICV